MKKTNTTNTNTNTNNAPATTAPATAAPAPVKVHTVEAFLALCPANINGHSVENTVDATGTDVVTRIDGVKAFESIKRKSGLAVYCRDCVGDVLEARPDFKTIAACDGFKRETLTYTGYNRRYKLTPAALLMAVTAFCADGVKMPEKRMPRKPAATEAAPEATKPEAAPKKAPEASKKAPKKADKKPAVKTAAD